MGNSIQYMFFEKKNSFFQKYHFLVKLVIQMKLNSNLVIMPILPKKSKFDTYNVFDMNQVLDMFMSCKQKKKSYY